MDNKRQVEVQKTYQMSTCEILDPDCRLYRTMNICFSSVSVTWVYGLWCMPAWLMSMWLPADDVISILFSFAADAIHALTTYIGTLPTECKYFQL